jgi:hypothetical protein
MWAILRSGQGRWSTDMQRHRFVSALSEARFHKSVKLGEVLCARSIEPLKVAAGGCGGCGANGWTRSNGYGN